MKVYRISQDEKRQEERIFKFLNSSAKKVDDIQIETCFYIQLDKTR